MWLRRSPALALTPLLLAVATATTSCERDTPSPEVTESQGPSLSPHETPPAPAAPAPSGGTLERTTPSGHYRLAIPAGYVVRAPNVDVLSDPEGDTSVAVQQALWTGDGPALIGNIRLAVTSYPQAWMTGTDAAELQGHLTDMAANPGFVLVSQQPVSQAGLEGLEFIYRMPTSWGESVTRARTFRVGGDLIVIEAVAANPEGNVTPEQLASDTDVDSLLAGFLWSAAAP